MLLEKEFFLLKEISLLSDFGLFCSYLKKNAHLNSPILIFHKNNYLVTDIL
jgi:hypothetical protein